MASGNTTRRAGLRQLANHPGSKAASVRVAVASMRKRWLRAEHRKSAQCRCCGQTTSLKRKNMPYTATVDHIVPTSRGGADLENNWQLLCLQCNQAKADSMPTTKTRRKA